MAEKTFHSITLPGQDTARVPLTAAEFSTSVAYKVKDYCTYQGKLYRCITAHAAGAWNAAHFTATDIDAEFDRKLDIPVSQASAPANPRVGDLWIDNDENSPIYNVDASPTLNSTNAVQSGGTKAALNSLDSRKMEHGVITGDFSASVDYRVGDLVFNSVTDNGITRRTLYRCTTDHNAAAWNAAHFTATTLEVELQKIRESEADTDMIGDLFGAKSTYAVGDYCVYNDNLYRCIRAVDNSSTSTPAFDPNDWTQVKLANDVSDIEENQIPELKSVLQPIEYIPMEQGSINIMGGNVDSSKHIRTVGYVYGIFTISCNADILVSRCIYINKFSGEVLRSYDIGLNVYRVACNDGECARIVFRRADNADIMVSDVKLNLYTEKLLSEQMQMFFDTVPLESGGIDIAGYVADNDRRIRTACYLKGRFNLLIPDGFKAFRVFYYNDQTFSFDSFVEPTTQLVSIYKAGCVSKIVFSKSNDSLTITPSDITRFTQSQSEMIQQLKNKDNMLYEQIDSFYQDTDKLFVVPGQLVKTGGESIILGGFIVDNSELITTDYIPVIPGELITVKGRGSDASTALVVFYDKNYYPLSSISGASYDNTDVRLTVPPVSAYIRVCKETNKTGIVDCLATRRENNFGPKRLKPQYTYHAYTLPLQTALPDELLGTSASYDQSNVPNYIFDLYDSLMERYPNYISKVNLNVETGIGAQSEYPIYMYTFIPPSVTTSDTLDETNEKMKKALLVSGAHSELTGVYGLYLVLKYICEHGNADNLVSSLRYCTEIDVIPVINPYGLANGQSVNENGVDFERNSRTNDWEKMGTAGTKGFTGNAPLSEINSQIVSYLFANNKYDIFVDSHNFYNAAGRSLCWVNPPLAPGYGDELYSVGCNHVKSMTALFKNQYQNTFPMDDFLYGYVTIPHENMRPGTGYVGLPYRAAAQYGTAGVIIESCETCSYINGIYDPTHYVRGTAEVETRAAENIINIIMTLLI